MLMADSKILNEGTFSQYSGVITESPSVNLSSTAGASYEKIELFQEMWIFDTSNICKVEYYHFYHLQKGFAGIDET